jgi:hypothetical protein
MGLPGASAARMVLLVRSLTRSLIASVGRDRRAFATSAVDGWHRPRRRPPSSNGMGLEAVGRDAVCGERQVPRRDHTGARL